MLYIHHEHEMCLGERCLATNSKLTRLMLPAFAANVCFERFGVCSHAVVLPRLPRIILVEGTRDTILQGSPSE